MGSASPSPSLPSVSVTGVACCKDESLSWQLSSRCAGIACRNQRQFTGRYATPGAWASFGSGPNDLVQVGGVRTQLSRMRRARCGARNAHCRGRSYGKQFERILRARRCGCRRGGHRGRAWGRLRDRARCPASSRRAHCSEQGCCRDEAAFGDVSVPGAGHSGETVFGDVSVPASIPHDTSGDVMGLGKIALGGCAEIAYAGFADGKRKRATAVCGILACQSDKRRFDRRDPTDRRS